MKSSFRGLGKKKTNEIKFAWGLEKKTNEIKFAWGLGKKTINRLHGAWGRKLLIREKYMVSFKAYVSQKKRGITIIIIFGDSLITILYFTKEGT